MATQPISPSATSPLWTPTTSTSHGLWAPNAVDRMVGGQELIGPAGVRDYFSALFAAFPDFSLEVLECTTARSGPPCAGGPGDVRRTGHV